MVKNSNDDNTGLSIIMKKLDAISSEITTVKCSLTDRIDKLERELEQRLSDKICKQVDKQVEKRLSSEMKKAQKSLDERFDTLKTDISEEIDAMSGKMNSLTDTLQAIKTDDRSSNIVIRKLPESINEQIVNKVQTLIKDQLKLNDVQVIAAKRLQNYRDSNAPGLVIATLQNTEERNKVLKEKSALRNTAFRYVFIHADTSKEDRLAANNLRNIVNAVNNGGSLSLRGNRVVNATHSGSRDNREPRNNDQSSQSHNNAQNSAQNNAQNSAQNSSVSDGGLYSAALNRINNNRQNFPQRGGRPNDQRRG